VGKLLNFDKGAGKFSWNHFIAKERKVVVEEKCLEIPRSCRIFSFPRLIYKFGLLAIPQNEPKPFATSKPASFPISIFRSPYPEPCVTSTHHVEELLLHLCEVQRLGKQTEQKSP
jgi:hypothetical protein